ncbi:MAG: S8 family serine peptidase [Chlorobi bacterium]|nr:S8 family serine peptidase [Chlorobiota bacterium]
MLNRQTILLPLLFLFVLGLPTLAQEQGDSTSGLPYLPPWNFMSLSTAGIDTFLLDHPTYDGRGVVVLIFDTGIDPSIPGLQRTSTGAPKVIDLVDVSGSNLVDCYNADIDGAMLVSDSVPIQLTEFEMLDPQPIDGKWYPVCVILMEMENRLLFLG